MFRRIRVYFNMTPAERRYRLKKILYFEKISSKLLVEYLREKGVDIGEGTIFHDPDNTIVGTQRPWSIIIGKYCKITSGVTILDYDYSRSVLRLKYGEIIGEYKRTVIGDNVFLGIKSTILMGTKIGSNCIVGAGSVVHGSFPDNVVIAGNPARIICSLSDYLQKRRAQYIEEGLNYARDFYATYERIPSISEMKVFFPLFLERSSGALKKYKVWTNWAGDDESLIIKDFLNSAPPPYSDYEHFLIDALKGICDESTIHSYLVK